MSVPSPFQSEDYKPLYAGQAPPRSCRVFRNGDFVVKVFDKKEAGKPNMELLRKCGIPCSVEDVICLACLETTAVKKELNNHFQLRFCIGQWLGWLNEHKCVLRCPRSERVKGASLLLVIIMQFMYVHFESLYFAETVCVEML